jgi:hypothetical protein
MKRFLIALIACLSISAHAWQPTKPITVIFPNGPGAGNEISFKIVSDIVDRNTGAKFVADYKPGADGNLATNYFNTVANDGYTISVPACNSQWVTAEVWYPQMIKFNIFEFEPVANIARSPLAFWAALGTGLFNSIMWSNIFTLAIKDLKQYTSQGSSLLVMMIGGGAIVPLIMGATADRFGIQLAFAVPILCYFYIAFYGFIGHRVKSGSPLNP